MLKSTILSAVAFMFLFVVWTITPAQAHIGNPCPHKDQTHLHCTNGTNSRGAILVTDGVSLGPLTTMFSIGPGFFNNEERAQIAAPRSGTLANLFVVPDFTPLSGSIMTVTVRVNGVDTDLSVTHTDADGASAIGNTIDTVSVNQGDLISVRFSESGGVGTNAKYRASFEFM